MVHQGQRGVEIAAELLPDLVLCDLGLPDGMSGHDVARALRAEDRTCSLKLIALSGYGRPEDLRKSQAAGFDLHITKPVSFKDLEQALWS